MPSADPAMWPIAVVAVVIVGLVVLVNAAGMRPR